MDIAQRIGHRLIQLGVLLFLLGLMTGFVVPVLALPRMGLASHLEGLMNGIFLMALGLVWPRLSLTAFWHQVSFWLAVFGTFANWLAVLLSAFWGLLPPCLSSVVARRAHRFMNRLSSCC